MHYRFKKRPDKYPNGLIINTYLIVYSLYRIFIESYRIDSSYVGPIKVVYLICGGTIVVALFMANTLINKFIEKKKEQRSNGEEKKEN
jgi:prolipoprotein diacylglyceryltransferase